MIDRDTRTADTEPPPAPLPSKVAVCRPGRDARPEHLGCMAKLCKAEPEWMHLKLGGPCVDIVRAILAESALEEGAEILLWVDSDMTFDVETAQMLVKQAAELDTLVGVLYAQKSFGSDPNVQFKDDRPVPCYSHPEAGLFPVHLIGFGMVAHPAHMLETIAREKRLPALRIKGKTYRPWYTCDFRVWDSFHSDDYTFCRHAIECGFELFADTRAKVGHVGSHTYYLEDGGLVLPRHTSLELRDRLSVEKAAE